MLFNPNIEVVIFFLNYMIFKFVFIVKCLKCENPALVQCMDCMEVYCVSCSNNLHKSARGLMSHKINSLSHIYDWELDQNCVLHSGSTLEFFCRDCQVTTCCYCLLENHNQHTYNKVSFLVSKFIVACFLFLK